MTASRQHSGPYEVPDFDDNPDFNDYLDEIGTFEFEGYDGYDFPPSRALYDHDSWAYVSMFSAWEAQRTGELLDQARYVLTIRRNRKHFARLCALIETQSITPFIGAGLSIPCGCPGWTDYLHDLASNGYGDPVDVERRLREQGDYETVASELEEAMGITGFDGDVVATYTTELSLRGAMLLLPALTDGFLITTNFDPIIERSFERREGFKIESIIGPRSTNILTTIADNKRVLFKLHGDAEDRSSRVLTLREYHEAYGQDGLDFDLPLPSALKAIFSTRHLLFLGCSLGPDRTLGLFHHVASSASGQDLPHHFAIVEQPEEDEKIIEREHFLTERHIMPIWYPYGDHDSVLALMTLLVMIKEGNIVLGEFLRK